MDTTGFTAYESDGTSQHVENTFVNLSHLEGETVKILGTDVDDNSIAYDDEIVTGGIITLMVLSPHAHNFVRKAIVGLPFRYTLSPMRLDITTAGGTSHGSIGHIAEIVISFLNTLNAKYGSSLDDLKDIDWTSLTSLNTGDFPVPFDGGYSIDDVIYISDDGPFPCTIRSLIPRKDVTGR